MSQHKKDEKKGTGPHKPAFDPGERKPKQHEPHPDDDSDGDEEGTVHPDNSGSNPGGPPPPPPPPAKP